MKRKYRSESILATAGIPFIAHLQPIESSEEIVVPPAEEIAIRATCLLIMAAKANDVPDEVIQELSDEFGVKDQFTAREHRFLNDQSPSEQDMIQFSWRSESAWVLFWALGTVDDLNFPQEQCSPGTLIDILETRGLEALKVQAQRRSNNEILDAADFIYRCHWAIRNARHTQSAMPPGLDPGITMERHHALNWLIGFEGQAWDDVTTDT